MTLEYAQAVEGKRRPWQRRIEVFSPKLRRRLTLFSRDALDAWILLEADPHVHSFCERPAYMVGNAGRVLDFWIDRGRHQHFWVVSPTDTERSAVLPFSRRRYLFSCVLQVDPIPVARRDLLWGVGHALDAVTWVFIFTSRRSTSIGVPWCTSNLVIDKHHLETRTVDERATPRSTSSLPGREVLIGGSTTLIAATAAFAATA